MDYFTKVENFLPLDTVARLRSLLDSWVKTKEPNPKVLPNMMFGFEYKMMQGQLQSKLEELLGPHQISDCFLQRSVLPLPIHSDWGDNYESNDRTPGYAVLFPLSGEGTCHTIVFEETLDRNLLDGTEPTTGYEFTEEYKSLLSHNSKKDLDRVSNPRKIKWKLGDAIVWDRKHMHCSDNFTSTGTDHKDSFVLFTTK